MAVRGDSIGSLMDYKPTTFTFTFTTIAQAYKFSCAVVYQFFYPYARKQIIDKNFL